MSLRVDEKWEWSNEAFIFWLQLILQVKRLTVAFVVFLANHGAKNRGVGGGGTLFILFFIIIHSFLQTIADNYTELNIRWKKKGASNK